MRWLVIDVNYLAHRAHHTTGRLSHNGRPTGVLFGVLRDLRVLQRDFDTMNVCFCFDHGDSLRCGLSPTYKKSRKDRVYTSEEEQAYQAMRDQVTDLRTSLLYELGYMNVCYARGYEADDVIASVCTTLSKQHDVVIVSADKDLYQLLGPRVSLWKPQAKKLYTQEHLAREFFGLTANQWFAVKAIAGCPGDGVVGVTGVGEITAAKYLRGLLKATTKAYKTIEDQQSVWTKNELLVKLPYPECPEFEMVEDDLSSERWAGVLKLLGMLSLIEIDL